MPRDITVTFEDGSKHVYRGAPDNITPDQVSARAAKEFGKGVSALDGGKSSSSYQSAAESAGSSIREAGKQIVRAPGLAARYGIEGIGQAAEVVTEPLRQMVVNPLLNAVGAKPAASTGRAASAFADFIGLPSPQNADERVVGDAARMVASSATMGGVAKGVANATTGVARGVAQSMAANQGIQAAGATGAGLAGGAVRESGGGPVEQFLASLAGGLAGGVGTAKAVDLAKSGAAAVKNLSVPRADRLIQADGVIELTAQKSGIDYRALAPEVQRSLREEVASAMSSGRPLDQDALRRLMSFRATGATPTQGMLTQNPVQITREKNLAKIGANTGDQALQKLPMLENQNVRQLLGKLDEAGAANAPSLGDVGMRAISSLESRVQSANGEINSLYQSARDSSGRSLPLEGGTFTRRASQLLDDNLLGYAVPASVEKKLNQIASGEVPFTVEFSEQLKTVLGNIGRADKGGATSKAMGLIRRALDEAPLINGGKVNPNNLPAVPGTVPESVQAGEQAILAFNKARKANASWMAKVESNPALKAVVDGAEPDQFVQKFILSKSAPAADVSRLKSELDPQSIDGLKKALVGHLKSAATGNTDDIAKFSNSAYRKALRDIGDQKLAAFFTAEERQMLADIGEAGKYMQAQPAGSAVNNSNSGALIGGRALDMLDKLAGFVPLGGADIIRGKVTQPLLQREAFDPRNALLKAAQVQRTPVRVNPLLAAIGTTVEPRDNQRGN